MSPQKETAGAQTTFARLGDALRHPCTYARQCGFGTFQILFLPAVAVGSLLTVLYFDQAR